MKKIKIFFWVSIICSGLVGCKYLSKITSETENNTNTEIEIEYAENRDKFNYFSENISFGINEKNKIKQWAFSNDGTFDYFVNDIETWGDDSLRSCKNRDINCANISMPDQSAETIIAIIDTSFCIDKFSMGDSVWINPNEVAGDGLDNDNNGYIDDIQGYNFCEMNKYINNDAEHGTAILGIMCAKPKPEENIITVASMRSDGKIDYTSNYGKSSVDLVAPGTDIVSVIPSGRFAYFSGTSYAVPFVGGVAAKIYNRNKNNMSSLEVKKIILDNVKVSKELGKYVKSSGMLDEKRAIENCIKK